MNFDSSTDKKTVFEKTEKYISGKGLRMISKDEDRPWGGFLVLNEEDAEKFISVFFPDLSRSQLSITGKLSPKILIVAPNKRLSWQYHHRRAEIWKQIGGESAVATSDTDEEKDKRVLKAGDSIELKQGERHRLIGLNGWGIVAEMWRHTDSANPSNEDDIVRVQDDYGR